MTTQRIFDSTEPWRYRCPDGHASLGQQASADHVYCKTCNKRYSMGQLVDAKDAERTVTYP